MSALVLPGCRAEPLGAYLKSLGVLRLVAEQEDPDALGQWADSFVLATSLSWDQLADFFLDRYRPTPLVAPWNGGSGFDGRDAGIGDIERSDDERFRDYQEAIEIGRRLVGSDRWPGLTKKERLEVCRGELPDSALGWLDALAVLTDADKFVPAPLLGTGGNLGRLELSNNFMQRLVDVLGLRSGRKAPKRPESLAWLRSALFADEPVRHLRVSAGQFDPGRSGGVLSSPLEEADKEGFVNPWDFVLQLEGALLFAASPARRMGSEGSGLAAVPFTVHPSSVGFPSSAPTESSKGELWAPLWSGPASAGEVARMIGEGRAAWGGRHARSGLDMARAARTLGVDRGIAAFVRHAFVERKGQDFLAVPVGHLSVARTPDQRVGLTEEIDLWVESVRRAGDPPATVVRALHTLDRRVFELTHEDSGSALLALLVALATLERAVGRSSGFRDKHGLRPVQGLSSVRWLSLLDDDTCEFRLASVLASRRAAGGACLRWLLTPTRLVEGRVQWTDRSSLVPGLGLAPLPGVLAAVHHRRLIEARAEKARQQPAGEKEAAGVPAAFPLGLWAPVADALAFVHSEVDDRRLAELLGGLMLLRWPQGPEQEQQLRSHTKTWHRGRDQLTGIGDPAWTALVPFFHGRPLTRRNGDEGVRLRPEVAWVAQLARGRVDDVAERALRRLRIAHMDPPAVTVHSQVEGARLAAALLLAVRDADVRSILDVVCPQSLDEPHVRVTHPTQDRSSDNNDKES